jgi:hypothetical protein
LPLDTWPDFESYPRPSPELDAALMREVDLSAVPLNSLQTSIMNAILDLYGTDLAAMGMRLADAKDAQALLNRVKTLRYPTR